MPSNDDDQFADIRPYNDNEVPGVITRLKQDRALANNLARLRLPWLHGALPIVARFLVRRWIAWKLAGVSTVEQFQGLVEPQLQMQIDQTAVFSSSGLDALSPDASYLFISNHRDIAMDPAFTNHALYHAGHRTVSIAIGDNLLREQWVADLMRLNKSFIVKRNITAPRELLAASRHLAGFIREMITGNRGSVWIAQREGRAKDGNDATEPAVIKMLSLSQDRKRETLGEALATLHIVPVAIAYELDPCDAAKAAELAAGAGYTKADDEDVLSIGRGIAGQKGRVHLAFGEPICPSGTDTALDVATVVAAIDRHIAKHYQLFECNLWAWQRLEGCEDWPAGLTIQPGTITRDAFDARIVALPADHQPLVLAMYANPLRNALAVSTGAQ